MNESFAILSRAKFQRIFLVMMVASVYGMSLLNGFVWDDNIFFIGNPVYKEFSLSGIFLSLANGVEYLPVRDITYAFDYLLWGETPAGFHLTNLLFFTVNVLLAYELARLIIARIAAFRGSTTSKFTPFAVAILFAIHPINSEVANFITCRNVLVSGFFVFIAVICMIRHLDGGGYSLYLCALMAFTGAMFGKATALMLPLLLIGILPILFPGRMKRILLLLAPFFCFAVGFFMLFKKIAADVGRIDSAVMEFTSYNLFRKISLAAQIPFFYLKKLLFPYAFSVEYNVNFAYGFTSPIVVASLCTLLAVSAGVFFFWRKIPEIGIGLVWFITALLPVLNFFGTHPIVADRYAYIPVFGIMLLFAAMIERIPGDRLKMTLLILTALILSAVSLSRTLEWRSDETLWISNIRHNPGNSQSYTVLGGYYFQKGNYQKALALFADNAQIPWLSMYHNYFKGVYLLLQGDRAGSKALFLKTLENAPGFIGPLYRLGEIAELEKDYFAAAQYFNKALHSSGKDLFRQLPSAREKIDIIKRVWLDGYLLELREKVERNPADVVASRELALNLERLCLYEEALAYYLAIEKMGIKHWGLYQNIANCYFNMNRSAESVYYYEQALAHKGGDENTYNNLGISYRKLGSYDKSVSLLKEGGILFPSSSFIAYNLAVTYHYAGKNEMARNAFKAVVEKFPNNKDGALRYLEELSASN